MSTYAAVRTAYLIIALLLTLRLNEQQGIARYTTLTAFVVGVPAALIGARLLDVLEYRDHYETIRDVVGRDGSSIYGALGTAFLVLWTYAKFQGFAATRFLDGSAPAMALGECMSRIGCFLSGCCYGTPTGESWGVVFPHESFVFRDQVVRGLVAPGSGAPLPVHPVQLYSAILMLAVFVVLLRMVHRPHPDGAVFYVFLVSYGSLRLSMVPFRAEALTSMKAFSILFVAGGILGLIRSSRRADGWGWRQHGMSDVE